MTAVYPGAIKVFTTRHDNTDVVFAAHVDDLQDEVAAVQTTLGVNPQVSPTTNTNYVSVKGWLDSLQNNKSDTGHTHPFGNPSLPTTYSAAASSVGSGSQGALQNHVHGPGAVPAVSVIGFGNVAGDTSPFVVPWQSVLLDTDSWYTHGSTNLAMHTLGWWNFNVYVQWQSNATGSRAISGPLMMDNGGYAAGLNVPASSLNVGATEFMLNFQKHATTAQNVTFTAAQDSGSTLSVVVQVNAVWRAPV